MSSSICSIILAAGTSTRMGKSKQLLLLNGRPLLEHVIRSVIAGGFSEIIAVIGYEASNIQKAITIDDPRFRWIVNKDYLVGQSSSLKMGISNIRKHHAGVMVFLGDLPFISERTVQSIFQLGNEMLLEYEESFIIQPKYHGAPGHPVFFGHMDKNLFTQLQGDHGARKVMDKIAHRIHLIVEDEGILFDIDTPDAYEKAKQYTKK
ncbi:nucleotidyltransferase family protein [Bacillus sp. FJAT-29790]|uniref:nucleotidyltransferase family protein n=1 Tax=Bacillus sp. FJAT-29790 TaxID=1895002 RepID=UPI001C220F61|nr:nucleotidyltransferase family protein [Bacillus sp. FJAT-29790]MBU8880731.1 nucleotidyltransferase family protein [Bacillus sp. FJAT-29790]